MPENTVPFKIYCIGSNLESYECLKFLVEKQCKIDTLITLPGGFNKNVSDYYDLHDFCAENGIRTIDTTNVNSEETVQLIAEGKPQYLFTLGWSQIFKEPLINCFSEFVVGTHPAKLPYGRGRAPLPWTILEGLKKSAVSFFKIDTGVDTGKIIFQREFKIREGAYVQELYDTVARELGNGFLEIYRKIAEEKPFEFLPQSEEGVTVRGKRTPSDGLIEFDRPVNEVERLIRAVSEPYPGAYCYYKDKKVIFWEVEHDTSGKYFGTLGQILKKGAKGILVQFRDGTLWLNKPTFSDGEAIELKFFRFGDKLGYNIQDAIFLLKNAEK